MKQFIKPYIMCKDSKEVAEYYVDMFNARINYIMLGKDTPDCPLNQLERVMHLELVINDHIIYLADEDIEDHGRIHLHLDFENQEEMEEIFDRLAEESIIMQKLKKTFWGAVYGVLKDKYGVIWQFHFGTIEE